jgi:hypothetical protein
VQCLPSASSRVALFRSPEFRDRSPSGSARPGWKEGTAFPGRLRDYRYITRDNRTYVIELRERTIIEEID